METIMKIYVDERWVGSIKQFDVRPYIDFFEEENGGGELEGKEREIENVRKHLKIIIIHEDQHT